MSEYKSMNIFEKLLAITAEIETVQKSLEVSEGNKAYKAVSESAILDAVKPLEEKYGVYSYPVSRERKTRLIEREYMKDEQVRKFTMIMEDIEVVYRFVNVDSPSEYVETISYGTGTDSGDKAPGKGMTYADKYALMKMYKISTGDSNDPDSQASPPDGYIFGLDDVPFEVNDNPMFSGCNTVAVTNQQPAPQAVQSKPNAGRAAQENNQTPAKNESPNPVPPAINVKLPKTVEEAKAVVVEVGEFKGKTFGEMLATKPDRVRFYADKFNNPKYPHYKAAAQLILGDLAEKAS